MINIDSSELQQRLDLIYDNQAYYLGEPAWHGKGYVSTEPLNAREAAQHLNMIEYIERPFVIENPAFDESNADSVRWFNTNQKAIIQVNEGVTVVNGERIHGQPAGVIAVVEKTFRTLAPREAVEIFDLAMMYVAEMGGKVAPVESMFYLQKSVNSTKLTDRFVISVKVDELSIVGDRRELYLMFYIPMSNRSPIRVVISEYRPVCRNTTRLAIDSATRYIKFGHKRGVRERLIVGLQEVYMGMNVVIDTYSEALTELTKVTPTLEQAQLIVDNAFLRGEHTPGEPDKNYRGVTSYEQRFENYMTQMTTRKAYADLAIRLWEGESVDWSETPEQLKHTLYHLVTTSQEVICHAKNLGGDRTISILDGSRHNMNIDVWNTAIRSLKQPLEPVPVLVI